MSAIYLRHGAEFVAMHERPYETEALLQALLADHPEVLVGGEEGSGRGWALVKREAGVADVEDGANRWSLDHLFLDHQGIPTLVEVMRSSDNRARREVVAQMLDYAANATAFWKVEALQAWLEAECVRRGVDSATELQAAFGVTAPDIYWDAVRTNLAADRIRLVFVADEIAPELRSIVELLNRQMSDTEVLAIEVKQYVAVWPISRGTIVCRSPSTLKQRKRRRAESPALLELGTRQSLIAEVARRNGDEAQAWPSHSSPGRVHATLCAWSTARAQVRARRTFGSTTATLLCMPAAVWSYGAVEIPFDVMGYRSQAPFADSRSARDEFRRRINEAAPGARIPPEEQRPRPSFALRVLEEQDARQRFLDVLQWAFTEAQSAQAVARPGPSIESA